MREINDLGDVAQPEVETAGNVLSEKPSALRVLYIEDNVLVAQDLLDRLRSNAVRPTAFRILIMEIMDAVLEAKSSEIAPNEGVERGSLLQRLLDWAGDGKQPMSLHDFAAICKSPERRRALVQHQTNFAKTLEEMK